MNDNKFVYSYSPSKNQEVDKITAKYIEPDSKPDSDFEKLKKLDRQAELPGQLAGIGVGIAGTLIIGLGMTFVLSFNHIIIGAIVGLAGFIMAGIATPVSKAVTKKSRSKVRDEILELGKKIKNEN